MTSALRKNTSEPLRAHRLFQTRDIDLARRNVARKFCSHELLPGSSHRDFETCHNHVAGGMLSLNYLRYGCDISINPGELGDFYLVQLPLRGSATVRNGRRLVEADAKTASILNPTRETRMTWRKGCEKLLLQIDRAALHEKAEALTGRTLNQAVVFDPAIDLAAAALHAWVQSLRAAFILAEKEEAFGSKLHRQQVQIEEELVLGLLSAQPSTISHLLKDSVAVPPQARLRRARSFMLDNLSEPLTLSRIASAAGCSLRNLQIGFQKNFGCSPMQYLNRQRLNHAHYLLKSLPPDSLVSSVAYDSGFSHLGRFSIAYRNTFGCSPRETLASRDRT